MEQALVSIIVPVYNGEMYIKRCIKDILAQTYQNIEVILVDDGSTDYSGKILDDCLSIDKRIKVVHQKNGGEGAARNAGITIMSGDYLAFMDCDDHIGIDFIDNYIKVYEDDVTLIVSGYNIVNGKQKKAIKLNNHKMNHNKNSFMFLDVFKKYHGVAGYVWNKFYKVDIIRNNNLLFSNDRSGMTDITFNLQYMMYCDVIKFIAHNSYDYMFYDNSVIHSRTKKRVLGVLELNKAFESIALKFHISRDSYYLYTLNIIDLMKSYFFSYACNSNITYRDRVNGLKEIILTDSFIKLYERDETKNISDYIKRFLIKHKLVRLIILLSVMKNARK